ncbi:MAG: DNA replication/repair protein RecF [Pseudomonadota bacterium]
MPEAAPLPRAATSSRLWVERLTLERFRNYERVTLEAGPEPVVLVGPNGAGKTNLLEALSLIAPGQGLRRAPFGDLAAAGGGGGWAVAARVHTPFGAVEIGTGLKAGGASDRKARIVRIDGEPQSGSGALADYVEMVWVIPAMDGLFTGPATERRRFLDRLILCFDPSYRTRAGRFERAMQSRNRLLADGVAENARLEGFEIIIAETGVAIAAARAEAVGALAGIIAARRARDGEGPFPWATIALEGTLEAELALHPAVDVEDAYLARLRRTRERDRAAGRTLEGPHRSDLVVGHGPKGMPARLASTGEQKALLIGLVLAHAELVTARQDGTAPILLLDEVSAHLDVERRAGLYAELIRLGAQAWMTGTDTVAFEPLVGRARFWRVEEGRVTPER